MALDPTILKARLLQAQTAYHALQTGAMRAKVDHNGTMIEFVKADADKLKGYIEDLEGQLAEGVAPPMRRRALRQVFDYR